LDPSLDKAKGVRYGERGEEGSRRRNVGIAELFSESGVPWGQLCKVVMTVSCLIRFIRSIQIIGRASNGLA
jgi:hypothetical protein